MSGGRASGPHDRSEHGRPEEELNGPEEQTEERTAPAGDTSPTPVAAAPTARAAAVPRRRRGLVPALVLLVLGAAAVGGVLFLSGHRQQARGLRKQAEATLLQLSDGKAEEVYEAASPRFQQTLLLDRFVDLATRMNATLGRFVRATDVNDVGRAAGVAGMTARVELELQFENATTIGQFSFLRGRDGRWLLLGFNVDIPPDLVARAAALEAQEQKLGAPDEVIHLVRSTLEDVREGREAEVYDRASPAFKSSVSEEGFAAMLQSRRGRLGNFVRVLAIISSARSPDRYQATVQALLEYEKARTTGTFDFMRIQGTWRLLGFKVVIPSGDTLPASKPL